jgi:vacuolar-type H+-ATPase catalytic subunit A/Vma1
LDESESNISPDNIGDDDEDDSHKVARLKRNKMKKGRRNRAIERKEAWAKYRADLDEYHRKKVEREAEDRRMASKTYNDHYNKIRELAQELEAISHPNEEQRHLQEALRVAA